MNGKQCTPSLWETGLAFLFNEIGVGTTMLDLAAQSREDSAHRRQEIARQAYDTALRQLPKLALTGASGGTLRKGSPL